jgi:hypothetical protein
MLLSMKIILLLTRLACYFSNDSFVLQRGNAVRVSFQSAFSPFFFQILFKCILY